MRCDPIRWCTILVVAAAALGGSAQGGELLHGTGSLPHLGQAVSQADAEHRPPEVPKPAERLAELFASWEQAQRTVRSLSITFTTETREAVFDQREQREGTFRLFRNRNGEVFASYRVLDKKGKVVGLLNAGSAYLLDEDNKIASRLGSASPDLRGFLEKYFNPFVVLLDKKRANEKCRLEIVKQDKLYTYLTVTPKQVRRYGWFPDNFEKRAGGVHERKHAGHSEKHAEGVLVHVSLRVRVQNQYQGLVL
jgi:hypothetical protein